MEKEYPCVMCGKLDRPTFGPDTNAEMIAAQFCFYCWYWNSKLRHVNLSWWKKAVHRGWLNSAYLGIHSGGSISLGNYGRPYVLTLLSTGEQVLTNNLWDNGKVPDEWLPSFPDTAIIEHATPEMVAAFDRKTGFLLAKER